MYRKTALYCLTVFFMAGAAFAQDFEHVAPKQPAPVKPEKQTLEMPRVKAPAKNVRLLRSLKGLVLIASVDDLAQHGTDKTGIVIGKSLPLLQDPAFIKQLQPLIGRPFSTRDIVWIKQRIMDWYSAHDQPVVRVAFPAQDINSGTVQAVVTSFKLGKVKVSGNEWFSTELIRDKLTLKPGAPIKMSTLSNNLNEMNRNPFRTVRAALVKSDTIGDTDLELKTTDRLPLRVYAGYDNDGLPVTGRDRWSAGLNWGNVWGLDHWFSYRYITSPDLVQDRDRGEAHSDRPRLQGHSFSYIAPLPWGDTASVFGSYVQQVPDLGTYFDQVGHSMQLSFRYEKPLPSWWGISHSMQFGFDYKRSDNNLAFGGTSIYDTATNVEQFMLSYSATLSDRFGETALSNTLFFSPGGLSDGNKSGRFEESGMLGAKSDYVYDNLQITRITYLPLGISSLIKLNAQLASAELLPSEQLGLGGTETLRGYDPREASGTQGVLASLELRSPSWHPLRGIVPGLNDSAQVLAFYDSGFVANQHDQDGLPKSASLQSVGFGALYHLGRFVDICVDYGWQLATAPGNQHRHNLLNLSITMAY